MNLYCDQMCVVGQRVALPCNDGPSHHFLGAQDTELRFLDKDVYWGNTDDKASEQFFNTFNDFGKTITFPTFSYDEFQLVEGLFVDRNHCTNSNELQFKYDIFGGSLRLLRTRVSDIANEEIFKFVTDELSFYFGDVYVSNLYPLRRRPQLLLEVYKDVITYKLCNRIEGADNSGFYNGNRVWNDSFASGFMKSLAGAIMQREHLNLYAELKSLVQACGMGCKNNIYLEQPITRKVLVRRVEDIDKLLPTDYGLPVIANFPLIDAIIQPKYMIQATESATHIGATTQLTSIWNQLLERNYDKHAIVFVLSEKNYSEFKQYKSYANAVANETVQSVKRKRSETNFN
eukprot:gene6895-9447_t